MKDPIVLEICLDSVESALAAERGGATRIELCSNLPEGGVTPSAGLITAVRSKVKIDLHVIVRPRAGDFCYSEHELEVMSRDIENARALGAEGVVLGVLDASGHVDISNTKRLIDLARPMSVTFHRAFDMTPDLLRALEDVCATGADRILTSGGEATALQGADRIAALVAAANGRVKIMAGSGIRAHNVAEIVQHTGVREVHAGLSTLLDGPMQYRKNQLSVGKTRENEYQRLQVREQDVADLRAKLRF